MSDKLIFVMCLIAGLTGTTILISNNIPHLLMVAEYVNFFIFPTLVYLATLTNNPYNLLLIIPTAVFSAVETILASTVIFYNVKS